MNSFSKLTFLLLLFGLYLANFSPQLKAQQCPTGLTQVAITIQTDAYHQETSFQLRDLTDMQVVYTISPTQLGPSGTFTFMACVPTGHCLKSELIDAAGNGGSSVSLQYQSQTYTSPDPGNFDQFETILMGSNSCTDISPIQDWSNYVVTTRGGLQIGNGNYFDSPIAGGQASGTICIGERNKIDGWVSGGDIGIGRDNHITGYNSLLRFGTAPAIYPCGADPFPTIGDLHVTPRPIGNSTDCKMADIIPVGSEAVIVPNGATEIITPGNYTSIIINEGATLLAFKGGYTAQEIIVDGGRLLPGGGGVLCDIFFQTSNFQFGNGSTIRATINCDHVIVDSESEFEGYLHVMDPTQVSVIGDKNIFKKPACPPCEEALNKGRQGDQGFVPIKTPGNFEIVPHPVSGDQFRISAADLSLPAKLSIFHVSGSLIKEVVLHNLQDLEFQDRGGLVPGMYICKLDTLDGNVRTKKLMIQGR